MGQTNSGLAYGCFRFATEANAVIDPLTETIIHFREAIQLTPKRRDKKLPNLATFYRWSNEGCRGVVLETIQVGGTRCTSREAVARFFLALTAARDGVPAPKETPTARRKRAAVVNRELDKIGV